jgi:hypothetical protein
MGVKLGLAPYGKRKHRLRVFQKRVLGRLFRPKRKEVTRK